MCVYSTYCRLLPKVRIPLTTSRKATWGKRREHPPCLPLIWSHLLVTLSIPLCICGSVCTYVHACLSVCLSVCCSYGLSCITAHRTVCMSVCLSVRSYDLTGPGTGITAQRTVCMSVCLSVHMTCQLAQVSQHIEQCVHMSVCLSVCSYDLSTGPGITVQRTATCEEELRGTIQRKMRSLSLSNLRTKPRSKLPGMYIHVCVCLSVCHSVTSVLNLGLNYLVCTYMYVSVCLSLSNLRTKPRSKLPGMYIHICVCLYVCVCPSLSNLN